MCIRDSQETTLIVLRQIKNLLGGGLLLFLSACEPLYPPEVAQPPNTSSAEIPAANSQPVDIPGPQTNNAASNPGSEPTPEITEDVALLRPYLRGNSNYGWQPGQLGKPEEFWNQRVNHKPVNSESKAVTDYLSYVTRENKSDPTTELFARFDLGKKANNENYSIHVLEADADTPRYDFTPRFDEFWRPHCDRIAMPVPPNGRLQGQPDYLSLIHISEPTRPY